MSTTLKKIDFTRPTKFTPDHERRLHRALAAFCRTTSTRLSAELRLPIELEVAEVTQLTWANAHDRLSTTALCAVVELQPAETRDAAGGRLRLHPHRDRVAAQRPLRGTPPERRLTEIDLALARRLFDGLLTQMNVVWRDLAGVELRLAGVDSHLETAQTAPVSEPTLSLAMRARMQGTEYALTLLVPHRAIAPVEARHPRSPRRHRRGAEPDRAAGAARRPGRGRGRPARRDRRRGDPGLAGTGAGARRRRWSSARRVADGLGLCVEGVRVLRGKPGRSGSRRAVQVTGGDRARRGGGAGCSWRPEPGRPGHRAGRSGGGPRRGADPARSARCRCGSGRSSAAPRLSLATIVDLGPGAVIELDRRIDDPIALYVNGLRYAEGALTVGEDEEWGVRVDAITAAGAAP